MKNIWRQAADKWLLKQTNINNEKIDKTIESNLNEVKKVIDISKNVPSAMDAIFGDFDDDDDE